MKSNSSVSGGEESLAESVRCAGRSSGYDQAVLPRGRKWTEENVPGEVGRAAESALRAQSVHADHGYAHKNVHY